MLTTRPGIISPTPTIVVMAKLNAVLHRIAKFYSCVQHPTDPLQAIPSSYNVNVIILFIELCEILMADEIYHRHIGPGAQRN